jgi:hypothetical protein
MKGTKTDGNVRKQMVNVRAQVEKQLMNNMLNIGAHHKNSRSFQGGIS